MRRNRTLLVAATLATALILPAGGVNAATTVSYRLTGSATTGFSSTTMSGSAKARTGRESGTWSASFSQDLGAVLFGTFSLTSRARSFSGDITGGTFGPGTGTCTKSTIPVHGTIAGGSSFDVVLTRYGTPVNGGCLITSATVAGTASLVYP